MTTSWAERRRSAHQALAWAWLVIGVGSLGKAAFHAGLRDELWGLAVAVQGGIGLVLLGLSYHSWRRQQGLGRVRE